MDENVVYNIRRVKNNIDSAYSQMISVLNILKSDINVNNTTFEKNRINNATYSMNSANYILNQLIKK